MSTEFRLTSDFKELGCFVEGLDERQLRMVAEITPSIHRIAKIRGRVPEGKDISDICFDLVHFEEKQISLLELKQRLAFLMALESSYYPVASNLATNCALGTGLYERIPDFVDGAKSLVAKTVWIRWKPESGENFLDLHRKTLGSLKNFLVHVWRKDNASIPFAYIETSELETGVAYNESYTVSCRAKPIYRFRDAASHLSLSSIISAIGQEGHLGKVAILALMGYYPDGHGLGAVAKELGIKRERLIACLDEVLAKLAETSERGNIPDRSIKDLVEELQGQGVVRYKSGKNIETTNP